MKTLTIGVLCFTFINIVSSQTVILSPAVIKERAVIFNTNNDWFDQLDDAYFKLYESVEQTFKKFLAPYVPICNDILIAYGNLQASLQKVNASGQVVDQTPSGLITVANSFNSTCINFNTYELASLMTQLNLPGGFRTLTAIDLSSVLENALSQIILYVSGLPTPKSDACAINILTKFSQIYKPVVDSMLSAVDQVIASLPQLGANLTDSFIQTRPTLTSVSKNLNVCNNKKSDALKLACAQELESFYTNNSYANTAQVNEAFLIPAALYPTLAGPLYLDPNAIFPFYSGSFVQTPALQAQVAALKTIC